jgi:hypothetical protein
VAVVEERRRSKGNLVIMGNLAVCLRGKVHYSEATLMECIISNPIQIVGKIANLSMLKGYKRRLVLVEVAVVV